MPRAKKKPLEIIEQPKRKPGRPTLFDAQMLRRAKRYALLGATDAEVAQGLGIGQSTLYEWQNRYPEFEAALQSGKTQADAEVAAALYRDALNGNTTAQIFWLKNRRRDVWRDVNRTELSGPNGGPIQAITGTVVFDVASLGIKQREQFKALLLKAKAKEVEGESDD